MAIVRWVPRRDDRWVSVPRAWPPRPVWKPIVTLVAWAVGIGFFLVGLMTGSSADVYRWVTTGLWLAIGALWLVQWRRAVKDFDRRTSE